MEWFLQYLRLMPFFLYVGTLIYMNIVYETLYPQIRNYAPI